MHQMNAFYYTSDGGQYTKLGPQTLDVTLQEHIFAIPEKKAWKSEFSHPRHYCIEQWARVVALLKEKKRQDNSRALLQQLSSFSQSATTSASVLRLPVP